MSEALPPDWLPEKLLISGYDTELLPWLLEVFREEFGPPTRCYFGGCQVWFNTRTSGDPYPESLWHLITRDSKSLRARLVDLERARHLPWCAAIIQNANAPEVTCWHFRHERDNTIRAALWLRQWNYVVILVRKNRARGVFYDLVTAYVVDQRHMEEQLVKSYGKRLDENVTDWDE